jgi:hypothetical protein
MKAAWSLYKSPKVRSASRDASGACEILAIALPSTVQEFEQSGPFLTV